MVTVRDPELSSCRIIGHSGPRRGCSAWRLGAVEVAKDGGKDVLGRVLADETVQVRVPEVLCIRVQRRVVMLLEPAKSEIGRGGKTR
jgi:hypothetical protein